MKKQHVFLMLISACTMAMPIGCKKSNADPDGGAGESFVKLNVNGTLVYETKFVNAYHTLVPGSNSEYVLQLTSAKAKGDNSPSFVFNTAYNGQTGTIAIAYTGNSIAGGSYFDGTKVYTLGERDASGNRGHINVTITDKKPVPNTQVSVLSGTFEGKLVATDKAVITISGSFSDHAYPQYWDN